MKPFAKLNMDDVKHAAALNFAGVLIRVAEKLNEVIEEHFALQKKYEELIEDLRGSPFVKQCDHCGAITISVEVPAGWENYYGDLECARCLKRREEDL